MVIGLTGGIGCGKSTAVAAFAEFGLNVVETDQLARKVLESVRIIEWIAEHWGKDALTPQGAPDRHWIADRIFADEKEKALLESMIHPEVSQLRRLAVRDNSSNHVVEIPLLFEKDLCSEFDLILCVACSDPVRFKRLHSRGLTRNDIQKRINSQLPISDKINLSDYVMWNDGVQEFLRDQVKSFVAQLKLR